MTTTRTTKMMMMVEGVAEAVAGTGVGVGDDDDDDGGSEDIGGVRADAATEDASEGSNASLAQPAWLPSQAS